MGFDAPFNHEFFISAEAGVVSQRDPDFTTLEAKMNMDNNRREPEHYLCATNKYATGLYVPASTWTWAHNCTHWLSRGQEIYILSFWANRQKHIVNKERWHKSCWEALQGAILESGAKLKQQADESKAKKDFELAQYRLANPLRPGKRKLQESHHLTDEQVVERKKLIAKRNTYKKLITKYLTELKMGGSTLTPERSERLRKQLLANNTRISEFEIQLMKLGGLPGASPPSTFTPAYDAVTQSITRDPDYYDATDKEHYYEGGDIDYNDSNEN